MEPQLITVPRDTTAGAYPVDRLAGHQTALILFAAGFGGINDAAHILDAGLTATCVDNDQEKLDGMWSVYPDDWEFVCMDAYHFANVTDRRWDVVSLDPFTNEFTRCADNIDAWCRLARRLVILGTGADTLVRVPDGWEVVETMFRTSYQGGTFWTVLERT